MNKAKLLFLLLIIPLTLQAQDKKLHLIARPLKDSILLRWAPSNYNTWTLGNEFGYKVVRYTMLRDSIALAKPEKRILSTKQVKVAEMNQWESLVKTNKYAGIAAQALFGETFDLDAGKGFNPQGVTYKAKEQRQRFAFALFAADRSPKVARMSGLWWTDKTAKKNEKYLYRVFIDLPDSLLSKADTAFFFTGIPEFFELPSPVDFKADFGDLTVLLSWNIFAQDNIYTAWEIERSENRGRTFAKLSDEPIVPFFEKDGKRKEYTFKLDSLAQNNKEYQYRLRGISSFGETGPWSKPVTGKGIETINANSHIIAHQIDKKGVWLKWVFPQEQEETITGFKILRSDKHNVGFEDISGKIKANKRTYFDRNPLGTAYYKVKVYLDTTAQRLSFPYLVQLTDSIPPAKPVGLVGVADSAGIIQLSWKANTDEDIYGYRVFRSASGKDEFSQLTKSPVEECLFIDTVNKKDLNKSVFYKIIAIDNRQNQSEFSEVAKVVKVDLLPPSMPVLTETKATKEGVVLKWINSSSVDVARHEVFRKLKTDTSWIKLVELPFEKKEEESSYTDAEAPAMVMVRYQVVAVDEGGNTSEPSGSISVKALRSNKNLELRKLSKVVDYDKGELLIQWQKPEKEVLHYKVYRKFNETPYSLYETIAGNIYSFEDYKLKHGDLCAYRIRVVYDDGSVSGFSKEIRVQF